MQYNNENEDLCEVEKCPTCQLTDQLVEEFSQMVYEDVQWENALRHVLGIAFAKDDEMIAELVDSTYTEGFHHGVMVGIENAQMAMENLGEYMANKIAEDEKTFNEMDDLIIFDDEVEESFDDIQAIIKKNQK